MRTAAPAVRFFYALLINGFPGETNSTRCSLAVRRSLSVVAEAAARRLRSLATFSARVRRRRISGRRLGADIEFSLACSGVVQWFVFSGTISRRFSALTILRSVLRFCVALLARGLFPLTLLFFGPFNFIDLGLLPTFSVSCHPMPYVERLSRHIDLLAVALIIAQDIVRRP